MQEVVEIRNLGPIKSLKMEVKPLTVLVGPQASGKSLVAQVLYFFRTLRSELARKYHPDLTNNKMWQNEVIRGILDELRGEPFGYFANKTATIHYGNEDHWKVSIHQSNRTTVANPELKNYMSRCLERWRGNSDEIKLERISDTIYIPTERTLLTRFLEKEPSIIYSESQPLPFRRFADSLMSAQMAFVNLPKKSKEWLDSGRRETMNLILKAQLMALKGEAYVPPSGPKTWKFHVPIPGEEEYKVLPLSLLASGQMEAWPFFAVAATWGMARQENPFRFFFEEPETHLHPAAQRIVMETIALLVNQKRGFFVTTHSPYILYTINNLMQTYMSYKGKVRDGMPFLNPDEVIAYRLTEDGKVQNIMDKETGLMSSQELDEVADSLGSEFEKLLDLDERN